MSLSTRLIIFIGSLFSVSIYVAADYSNTLLYVDLLEFFSKTSDFNDDELYYLSLYFGAIERLDFPKHHISLLICLPADQTHREISSFWLESFLPHYHSIAILDPQTLRAIPLNYFPKEAINETNFEFSKLARMQAALEFARYIWARHVLFMNEYHLLFSSNLLNLMVASPVPITFAIFESSDAVVYHADRTQNIPHSIRDLKSFLMDYSRLFQSSEVDESLLVAEPTSLQSTSLLSDSTVLHSPLMVALDTPAGANLLLWAAQQNVANSHLSAATGALGAQLLAAVVNGARLQLLLVSPAAATGTSAVPLGLTVTRPGHSSRALRFAVFEHFGDRDLLRPSAHAAQFLISEGRDRSLGFDAVRRIVGPYLQIVVINLLRRPDRQRRIETLCGSLGIDCSFVAGVDGRLLNETYLEVLGVRPLEGFADPYSGRPIKLGEIGCFLSHYNVWRLMEARNWSRVLILEDDARFALARDLKAQVSRMLRAADATHPEWDLLYLGRKPLDLRNEGPPVVQLPDVGLSLVRPAYSYWLVGFALTLRGARKLLATRPLARLIPSDELVPLLTGRHPNADWYERVVRVGLREERSACSNRGSIINDELTFIDREVNDSSCAFGEPVRQEELLVALAVEPPLLAPAWFRGDQEYSSDTEESVLLR